MSYLATESAFSNRSTLADTSFTKQLISTTIVGLDSTEFTYTPTSGSTYVHYEVCASYMWDPDNQKSVACLRLQYSTDSGSTWTDFTGSQAYIGDAINADYESSTFEGQFIVDAWSGSRMIRLACRSDETATEFTFGKSWNLNNTEGVGGAPHVSIMSIR